LGGGHLKKKWKEYLKNKGKGSKTAKGDWFDEKKTHKSIRFTKNQRGRGKNFVFGNIKR